MSKAGDGCEGNVGRYIDPLSDWGFKRLFGTEMNKGLLLRFLQDLFPEKSITEITFMKTEAIGPSEEDRKAVFDVACMTQGGDRFIVEMQKRRQLHFMERSLYYSTFQIQEQSARGRWDYSMDPVVMVGILDFPMKESADVSVDGGLRRKTIHRYALREIETGELMTDRLMYVFLEVGVFRLEARELGSEMEKWMYVLRNLPKLTERPLELQEEVFSQLFRAAEIAAFTQDERNQYEHDMMTENDYWNTIEYARDEGRNEGRNEGLVEGRKAALDGVVKEMKGMGLPVETIARATGMSVDEVRAAM